jgi:nitrogen fixation/metabolism regulation signal transduction histidine kinase
MAGPALNRLLPVTGLLLLLASFYLLGEATEGSESFGQLYTLLLVVNALALLILTTLIGTQLFRLVVQYRSNTAGSRLTLRLVTLFVALAVAPVTVVYGFSLQSLHRTIDSWFDLAVDEALEDAVELSQAALGIRMRTLLEESKAVARKLASVPNNMAALALNDLRQETRASEITLLNNLGDIIASVSSDPSAVLPYRPDDEMLLQARQGEPYVDLSPIGDAGLHVRALIPLETGPGGRLLLTLFPVSERLSTLAESVQTAFGAYRRLVFLRTPLKQTFTLTLSLVLLLSVLAAVWAAFFSARRVVAPLRDLVEGTRAVAAGDYSRRLPLPSHDELGVLVSSFNVMSRRLGRARDQAERSQREVEEQRSYLQGVLARLSSGVITFDHQCRLRTSNEAAKQILGVALPQDGQCSLQDIVTDNPFLQPFQDALTPHLRSSDRDWREEVTLFGPAGRQVLMCRGAPLGESAGEHVVVFDDVSALIQAQRDVAWTEVARRLAHEIKNPLTPIQLSAERLRHKYAAKMQGKDAEVFDRSIRTIVQQVESMKSMVNAFADYARPPSPQPQPLDLNGLISDVLLLYPGSQTGVVMEMEVDPDLPKILADTNRLRQVLHNLVKNALEALEGREDGALKVFTHYERGARRCVELTVCDNGPGFPEEILEHPFEPYVTTKARGTGLGLPIVKKIVEEHGGMISVTSAPEGGACIMIRLPVGQTEDERANGAGAAS